MGAAICERMMATRPIRGAALMAPVPPSGLLPVAARLADHASGLRAAPGGDSIRRGMSDDLLRALRPFYFSDRVEPAILPEALAHLNGESPRVLFDLSMRLHGGLPKRGDSPLLVMGAAGDQDRDSRRRARDGRASRRRRDDPARHGSHADARAGVAEAAAALAEWLADLR